MKFLIIVILISYVLELVSRKDKRKEDEITTGTRNRVYHPAEYELR